MLNSSQQAVAHSQGASPMKTLLILTALTVAPMLAVAAPAHNDVTQKVAQTYHLSFAGTPVNTQTAR
jgi:ABC-type arginine/histidine transport system permease subunit